MHKHNIHLFCLVIVTFISFLGIALPYPILAPLFLADNSLMPFLDWPASVLYGVAMACYPIGQFFGSPILGIISDNQGRKVTLLFSLFMTCIGYLLCIWAIAHSSFILFILSRLFTGFWEGLMPIARAAAADLHKNISKTKSFGSLNAAATSGFLFGPIIGGALADNIFGLQLGAKFDPNVIFWFALVLTAIAGIILALYYQDTVLEKKHSANEPNFTSPAKALIKKIQYTWSPMRRSEYKYLIIMSTLVTLGFDIYYQFYPLYMVAVWKVSAFEIAVATIVLSAAMILMQACFIQILNQVLSPRINIIIAGLIYSFIIAAILIVNNYYGFVSVFFLLGMCIGMIGTNLPVFISDLTPADNQGQIMGLMMALRFLGDGIMCLITGLLATFSLVLPFLLAASFVIMGIYMFAKMEQDNLDFALKME